MEIRYADRKIRDFVVYETGIVPDAVEIHQNVVVIVVSKEMLEMYEMSAEEIVERMEPYIPRKLEVRVV